MATPPGRGAISIARLSGGGIPALCKALTGALPQPRRAELCDFRAGDGAAIDRGLALYFPAPHSYTGEHALELHAHGSPAVMSMLVRRCPELG
ncbi:MAG: tRNA uridine-5-carboxymethylaminomethyl(34) synthesis GTPase MnmE, partial [Gammaproteobacteria bacterium]|nr:tRNA uridine-5-carboxymethylaminomethyl(34) synthesis GTPase MnmE [Gammaproteobacteria bacterium]